MPNAVPLSIAAVYKISTDAGAAAASAKNKGINVWHLLLLVCFLASLSLRAQVTFSGCVDRRGLAVGAVRNDQLSDVAQALPNSLGPSLIQYNVQILSWLQPATRLFLFAHECAHLAVPTSNESVADCWAAQTLFILGLLNDVDVRTVQADINRFAKADWTHPSGPARSILINECLRVLRPSLP